MPLQAIFDSEMFMIRVDPSSKTKDNILQVLLMANAVKTFCHFISNIKYQNYKNSLQFQKEMTTLYSIHRKKMLPALPTWPKEDPQDQFIYNFFTLLKRSQMIFAQQIS